VFAKRKKPGRFFRHVGHASANRGTEPGDGRHAFRAGPRAALLSAAPDQRFAEAEVDVRCDEGARSLWPPDLMGGERKGVGAERGGAERNAPRQLHGVAEQKSACRVNDRRGFGNRLDDPGFVVRALQGKQRPARSAASVGQPVEIDAPVGTKGRHFYRRERKAMTVERTWMLAGRDDQPLDRRLLRPDPETGIKGRVYRFRRPG